VDPRANLDDLEKRKFLPTSGLEPLVVQPIASRCTDYATPDPWTMRDHQKYWESLTGLKQPKWIPRRTFCHKNYESVKTKQKLVSADDRITHKTLSPQRTSLQNGTVG
jgi:hypothetical protein